MGSAGLADSSKEEPRVFGQDKQEKAEQSALNSNLPGQVVEKIVALFGGAVQQGKQAFKQHESDFEYVITLAEKSMQLGSQKLSEDGAKITETWKVVKTTAGQQDAPALEQDDKAGKDPVAAFLEKAKNNTLSVPDEEYGEGKKFDVLSVSFLDDPLGEEQKHTRELVSELSKIKQDGEKQKVTSVASALSAPSRNYLIAQIFASTGLTKESGWPNNYFSPLEQNAQIDALFHGGSAGIPHLENADEAFLQMFIALMRNENE